MHLVQIRVALCPLSISVPGLSWLDTTKEKRLCVFIDPLNSLRLIPSLVSRPSSSCGSFGGQDKKESLSSHAKLSKVESRPNHGASGLPVMSSTLRPS